MGEKIENEENEMQEENLEQEEIQEPMSEEPVDEVSALKEKIAQLEDQYLRSNAEFENMRKRLEREKMQAVSYANELFARDMLSIIDAIEAAQALERSEDTNLEILAERIKEGIDLTAEQFKKSFEKHGISGIDTSGVFDPNYHEAVMQSESDTKKSGEILQVFQKGYKIKERVLRPAMVSIVS